QRATSRRLQLVICCVKKHITIHNVEIALLQLTILELKVHKLRRARRGTSRHIGQNEEVKHELVVCAHILCHARSLLAGHALVMEKAVSNPLVLTYGLRDIHGQWLKRLLVAGIAKEVV